ncbi:translocase [Brachybacterium sp. EF45031]|uniref:translocase n=1 Tax=Brachybacterium sillae TaxID=2810536 RepID=UPI00217CCE67|nr:translocase [Brachybacterium sillae]MCS6712442.1 translocase [Brachybacterium sillae]
MELFGLNGWEPVVLLLIFLVVIGPQRLPQYTRSIMQNVRRLRRWVDESRATVENEMGIAVEDLKKYDPRQYDPRRIIREAWDGTGFEESLEETRALAAAATGATVSSSGAADDRRERTSRTGSRAVDEGPRRAPFDPEAT